MIINNPQSDTMVFTFNNYYVELTKESGPNTYGVKILKVTGPAHFNRELIVESTIGISYECDAEEAVTVILEALERFSDVTREPEPQVGIERFGESAIMIGIRYWVPTRQYYQVMYQVNQKIYSALKDANIVIPFPRQDIHLIHDKAQ